MSIADKHYHPIVAARLRSLVAAGDWCGITAYLSGLSNAQFRTGGYLLAEAHLPNLPEEQVWALTTTLVGWNSRAMLVTLLQPIAQRIQDRTLSIHHAGFQPFAELVSQNEIDRQKTLLQLLPALSTPEDLLLLFSLLKLEQGAPRLPYLLRTPTMPASYVLLQTLRFVETDRALLVRTLYFLIKRGDALSFNLAALLRATFGLEEVRGTFSLRLEPYQLARLEESYPAFCQALRF